MLAPALPEVAADLGVSTATGGQLRSVTGLVAGLAAVAVGAGVRQWSLEGLLRRGLLLLCLGSLVSAAAPTFLVLALAQLSIGTGLGMVLSGGIAASVDWAPPERRVATLSVALIGQPVAWIIGMPVVGAASRYSWRLGWLLVPFVASLLALGAVMLRRPHAPVERPPGSWRQVARRPGVPGWAAGELLAFAGWSGVLVYAGALFVESYDVSTGQAGLLLGLGAVAYLPGNFLARRWVGGGGRRWLAVLALLNAVQVLAFGTFRQGLWLSEVQFAALTFTSGARTLAGSAAGLGAAPRNRLEVMSVRAAATQFGYLLGAGLGGASVASAGYPGLAVALSLLFLGAAAPHLGSLLPTGSRQPAGSPSPATTTLRTISPRALRPACRPDADCVVQLAGAAPRTHAAPAAPGHE